VAQTHLDLVNLGQIDDGRARAIIDAELQKAVDDLDDRGTDKKARQVVIVVTMQQMESGIITTDVEAHARLPKRRTHATACKIARREGRSQLVFQEFDPENADQHTIPGLERTD